MKKLPVMLLPLIILHYVHNYPCQKEQKKCSLEFMWDQGIEQTFLYGRITPLGTVAVEWSLFRDKPCVDRILLPASDAHDWQYPSQSFPDSRKSSCPEIDKFLDQIECFTNGENIKFPLDHLRLDRCSGFQQKVLQAESSIPRGKVSSYGTISLHLNVPGGARAVGTALATNPFPLVIACHRVIRSDGSLGGYQGGLEMKRGLLEKEGIAFNQKNQVVNPDFYNWK